MSTKFEGLNTEPSALENKSNVINDFSQSGGNDASSSANKPLDNEEARIPTNPNDITVQVSDPKAPIILLFGATSSGKSMTLVRLAKYLHDKKGYTVSVDPLFVTTKDVWEYEKNSANFNAMLSTTYALKGTDHNDFLFIKVCDKYGKLICQILEGAGEDYFPTTSTNRISNPFPPYMTGIFNSNNKKIWVFITEPNWDVAQKDRVDYVSRINFCKSQHFNNRKDECIILYNKVDKTPYVYGQGQVHTKNAMVSCNNEYQGLFNLFLNPSPWPWASKYTCKFVPFSTGLYGEAPEGQYASYVPSHDAYPHRLWETIKECIKG